MSLYTDYDGKPIVEARIVVPTLGAWYADLVLAVDAELAPKPLTLRAGDIAWSATPWRSKPYQGRTRALVIGGAGGLQKQLPAKHYSAPAGVKLSMVLGDAARECGEQLSLTATDRALGLHAVRDVGPAARTFNRWATEWHIGLGLAEQYACPIVVGPWETDPAHVAIRDAFQLLDYSGETGRALVATEALAAFTPGRTFASVLGGGTIRIGAVIHTLSSGTVRTEILAAEVRP